MEYIDKVRSKPIVQKFEKFFPAIAFLGGFGWDSVTLGMSINDSDLIFLVAYYIGALILVILLSARLEHPEGWTPERLKAAAEMQANKTENFNDNSKLSKIFNKKSNVPENAIIVEHHFLDREWSPVWKDRFTWALQFFFGGMFSALVVCYFKSSGSIASLVLVLLLAALLVGNEFLKKYYEGFGLNLTLFCLLGTMVMNFTLPHVVHRIGFLWFFISTLLSFGICLGVWKVARRPRKFLIAPAAISLALVIAYLMNWVPPVPLVLKQHIACQNFDKASYSCEVDSPTLLQKIGLSIPTVHKNSESEVYFLTSVYAPAKLKADIEYRWYYEDPSTGKYTLTDKISSRRMTVNGGRETGFRSYSKKKNVPAGRYRVETAYKDGAVIGSGTFEVFDATPEDTFVRDTLQ